jgi:hypothetical protein
LTLGTDAGYFLLKDARATGAHKVVELGIEILVGGRDAGVAEGVVPSLERVAHQAGFQNPLVDPRKGHYSLAAGVSARCTFLGQVSYILRIPTLGSMNFLFYFGLLLLTTPSFAQTNINSRLKQELDSLYREDQKYRELFVYMNNGKADSVETALHIPKGQLFGYVITHMAKSDSSSLQQVKVLLKQYGYPGKSLVGVPTNEAAWHIIQHSPSINAYLPMVKIAAEKGELPYSRYAQMLDRQLVQAGKAQLYGTQGNSFTITNKTTGKQETVSFIWPIKNPAQINARRQKAGFPTTVEEGGKQLGIPYKPVSLEYAKRVQAQSQGK